MTSYPSAQGLSEEAQDILDACLGAIAPDVFNPTPDQDIAPYRIKKLIGHEPSEQAMQELVDAGLLEVSGKDNLYRVVEE